MKFIGRKNNRAAIACLVGLYLLLALLPGCGSNMGNTGDDAGGSDGFGASQSNAFNLDQALELARLCLQSYQMLIDFDNGVTFTLPAPYTLVAQFMTEEPFEGDDFSSEVPIAYIATSGSTIYVIFRGTKTIVEWIDDAEFSQVPYSFVPNAGKTENGFTKIYASIREPILAQIKQLASSGTYTQLIISGHSLGGALAVLATPDLQVGTSFSNPIMYTFAGPRAGNPAFATLFNGLNLTSWRVVNTNDWVPFLPKEEVVIFENNQPVFFFYEHVDEEEDITFGTQVFNPTDVTDIENNHSLCNYYNFLCGETSDPASCMAQANGADGCNSSG